MLPRPPQDPPHDRLIQVGRALRAWGFNGEIKVEDLSDYPERFRPRQRLLIKDSSYAIQRSRRHKGAILVKLEGVDSLQEAEALRGAYLEVPESEAAALPEGTYFHFQILGLKVVTTEGEELGEVAEIVTTGSNDVYVTRGARGEVLIPAIGDVVMAVDLEKGVLTVEPLPGLL